MIHEVRVKEYFGTGSNSLEKYYKNKEKAGELAKQLNQYLPNMYFVNVLKLEEEDEDDKWTFCRNGSYQKMITTKQELPRNYYNGYSCNKCEQYIKKNKDSLLVFSWNNYRNNSR